VIIIQCKRLSNDLFGLIDQITTRVNVLELHYESLRRYMFIELFRYWANISFEKYPWAITFEVMGNCAMALPLATPLHGLQDSRRQWSPSESLGIPWSPLESLGVPWSPGVPEFALSPLVHHHFLILNFIDNIILSHIWSASSNLETSVHVNLTMLIDSSRPGLRAGMVEIFQIFWPIFSRAI
jgi:hypothetical protein